MEIPFQPLNQLFKNNQTNPMGIKNVIGNQPAPFPQVQSKAQILPQGKPNVPVTNLVNAVTGKIGAQATSPQDNQKVQDNSLPTTFTKTTPPVSTPNSTGGVSSTNNQTSDMLNPQSSYYQQNPNYLRPGETQDQYKARLGIGKSQADNTFSGGVNASGQKLSNFTPDTSGTGGTNTGTSFPGLISSLSGLAGTQNPQFQAAQDQYRRANEQLQQLKTAAANNQFIGAGTNMAEYAGTQGLLANRIAAEQAALTGEMTAAQAAAQTATGQQGTQQIGLGTAAGLMEPTLGQYGQTWYQKQIAGGGQGGGQFDPNTTSQQYAQDVISGARSYNDAVSAMGLYGGAGKQFLDNAIRQQNPNFNFSQAQALGTTQGTVAPQLNMAQKAIDNLTSTFSNLPGWQKFGIPLLNSVSNMFSGITGIGLESETAKQNAIKEARTQVANALGTMTNTTPTSWDATVQSWFPDNATPSQIQAGIEQFTTLGKNRQEIYGTPGQVQPYSGGTQTGGTSAYSYDSIWKQ